jgi:hypothetical protein
LTVVILTAAVLSSGDSKTYPSSAAGGGTTEVLDVFAYYKKDKKDGADPGTVLRFIERDPQGGERVQGGGGGAEGVGGGVEEEGGVHKDDYRVQCMMGNINSHPVAFLQLSPAMATITATPTQASPL